jgi:hypothetical protein
MHNKTLFIATLLAEDGVPGGIVEQNMTPRHAALDVLPDDATLNAMWQTASQCPRDEV